MEKFYVVIGWVNKGRFVIGVFLVFFCWVKFYYGFVVLVLFLVIGVIELCGVVVVERSWDRRSFLGFRVYFFVMCIRL